MELSFIEEGSSKIMVILKLMAFSLLAKLRYQHKVVRLKWKGKKLVTLHVQRIREKLK